MTQTTLLLGAGRMGGALASAWQASTASPAGKLVILEPAGWAAATGNTDVYTALADVPPACHADVLVLAVKPQMFADLLPGCRALLKPGTLIISIAAGISLERIRELLGLAKQHPVVRAMPNLPATAGAGMTGLVTDGTLSAARRAQAEGLFTAAGHILWVENEARLDALTAVSGSGPAYVFHLVEALAAAARHAGFSDGEAMLLARQTIIGSARLLEQSPSPASVLREQVTSPGGTTAAGLVPLMAGLSPLLCDTVQAAHKRATELAKF